MNIKTLTKDDVEFTVECLEEDIPVRGNVMASGDDDLDREEEDRAINDLNSGNPWAWCTVKVTAKHPNLPGIEGVDYLGGCSYKSQADFEGQSGYFDDMKDRALEELNREIQSHYEALKTLEVA